MSTSKVHREPNQKEIAALWLYSAEYTHQTLGCIDFYATLSQHQKEIVEEMLQEILSAAPADNSR